MEAISLKKLRRKLAHFAGSGSVTSSRGSSAAPRQSARASGGSSRKTACDIAGVASFELSAGGGFAEQWMQFEREHEAYVALLESCVKYRAALGATAAAGVAVGEQLSLFFGPQHASFATGRAFGSAQRRFVDDTLSTKLDDIYSARIITPLQTHISDMELTIAVATQRLAALKLLRNHEKKLRDGPAPQHNDSISASSTSAVPSLPSKHLVSGSVQHNSSDKDATRNDVLESGDEAAGHQPSLARGGSSRALTSGAQAKHAALEQKVVAAMSEYSKLHEETQLRVQLAHDTFAELAHQVLHALAFIQAELCASGLELLSKALTNISQRDSARTAGLSEFTERRASVQDGAQKRADVFYEFASDALGDDLGRSVSCIRALRSSRAARVGESSTAHESDGGHAGHSSAKESSVSEDSYKCRSQIETQHSAPADTDNSLTKKSVPSLVQDGADAELTDEGNEINVTERDEEFRDAEETSTPAGQATPVGDEETLAHYTSHGSVTKSGERRLDDQSSPNRVSVDTAVSPAAEDRPKFDHLWTAEDDHELLEEADNP